MAFNLVDLPNATITASNSTSGAITQFDDAYAVSIQAPATLTASQVSIQVAVSSGGSAAFVTYQSGGADIVLAAGKGLTMTPIPYRQLRIISSSVEGADRVFLLTKVFIV